MNKCIFIVTSTFATVIVVGVLVYEGVNWLVWNSESNPYWQFIYDFQTLITGLLAIAAASMTVITMLHTDRMQNKRHKDIIELSMRRDRMAATRIRHLKQIKYDSVKAAIEKEYTIFTKLNQSMTTKYGYFFEDESEEVDDYFNGMSWVRLTHYMHQLNMICASQQMSDASNLLSPEGITALQVIKDNWDTFAGIDTQINNMMFSDQKEKMYGVLTRLDLALSGIVAELPLLGSSIDELSSEFALTEV